MMAPSRAKGRRLNRRPRQRPQTIDGGGLSTLSNERLLNLALLSDDAARLQYLKLTPHGVQYMVNASKFPGSLIVRFLNIRRPQTQNEEQESNDHFLVTIHDGTHSCIGLVFHAQMLKGLAQCLASVTGYITSKAHLPNRSPLVFVTGFEILDKSENRLPQHREEDSFCPSRQVVQGGKAGTFLSKKSLEYVDLAGQSSLSIDSERWKLDLKTISAFMAHHSAMRTLQAIDDDNIWSGSPSKPTNDTLRNYTKALREFEELQLVLQASSLTGLKEEKKQVVDQNTRTLQHALSCLDQPLTTELLCEWHGMLMGNGLHPKPSSVRKEVARSETIVFGPPGSIRQELDHLCTALKRLETNLVSPSTHGSSSTVLGGITFAAAAFFGVVDIHPFSNGNWRLAQIVLNWALRRAGMPFCIQLSNTAKKRSECIVAIERARQNIFLVPRGEVADDDMREALKCAGLLSPIVSVLLEHIGRTAVEFGRLVSEKTNLASEEAEACAARRAREQVAQGTCIICFDEKPNIATLCCGKAVHLNCIAEWLSAHKSCPQCRCYLPSLPRNCRKCVKEASGGDDGPMVEQLLNYVSNESANEDDDDSASYSSSSSDSSSLSSSSSSSSSSSTPVPYSELYHRINYGNSDDDDQNTEIEIANEIDYADMFNEFEAISSDNSSNRQARTNYDHQVQTLPEEISTSEGIGGVQNEVVERLQQTPMVEQTVFNFADSSSSSSGDEDYFESEFSDIYGNAYRTPSMEGQASGRVGQESFPRLSFLDPSLLRNVQQNENSDYFRSSVANSSSSEEEFDGRGVNDGVPLLEFTSFTQASFQTASETPYVDHEPYQSDSTVSSHTPWLISEHFAFSDDDSGAYVSENSIS